MNKRLPLLIALLSAGLLVSVHAHDLFLKFDSYFLPANTQATARLLSGTFRSSENAVKRDRMVDVSLVAPSGARSKLAAESWRDEGNQAVLTLPTGAAGTYLAGVSLQPRAITLKARQFNDYLAHDGLPDTLSERRRSRELNKGARERYSKHVKAIFQVGEQRSDAFKTPLGYPVEIIPQQNPYDLRIGDTLEVLCVKEGQPLANQFVMAGRDAGARLLPAPGARTDANGVARIKLAGAGKWFVKFIHMTKLNQPELDYESRWASLSFEIK